jgi:hypothetical protein
MVISRMGSKRMTWRKERKIQLAVKLRAGAAMKTGPRWVKPEYSPVVFPCYAFQASAKTESGKRVSRDGRMISMRDTMYCT